MTLKRPERIRARTAPAGGESSRGERESRRNMKFSSFLFTAGGTTDNHLKTEWRRNEGRIVNEKEQLGLTFSP
ncbi:Hypothetical predicted protein [Xyrichtys novacula]|uniref:Uncharacterized protein n=1 Tax=Xyrichtys novacula TaxID=13765 RepID=A0AAV1GWP7_XYRNO|nr:Hypothetical predicted protein [Xyrichtys novacula]